MVAGDSVVGHSSMRCVVLRRATGTDPRQQVEVTGYCEFTILGVTVQVVVLVQFSVIR